MSEGVEKRSNVLGISGTDSLDPKLESLMAPPPNSRSTALNMDVRSEGLNDSNTPEALFARFLRSRHALNAIEQTPTSRQESRF